MIVGIDPGFANLGVVIASKPRQIDDVVFTKVGCMKTSPCKELSAAQDLILRSDDLTYNLRYFVRGGGDSDGEYPSVYAMCVEGFSRPPNVISAIKLGASHGAIGCLVSEWQPEVVVVEQPQAIRKAVMGVEKGKTPPEDEVHAFLLERYPELAQLLETHNKGDRPHILDAAACVVGAYKKGIIH